MPFDKESRRLYDKGKRAALTPTEKRKADSLRSERRKRRRENGPLLRLATIPSSAAEPNTATDVPFMVKVTTPCQHCGAKRFQFEPPTFCCFNGQISLKPPSTPTALRELFEDGGEQGKEFRTHIRAYNSLFSFTSLGICIDKDLASSTKGVYTFRAQGQVYHELPALLPGEIGPCYFQLYFYDTSNELDNRMRIFTNPGLSEAVVQTLMDILSVNPYASILRRLSDLPLETCSLRIISDAKLDQRVYNSPSADDVAAIWVEGNNSQAPSERDITIHSTSGQRHRIRYYYGCYDPLQYPLLFPYGDNGWHVNILRSTSQSASSSSIPRQLTSAESILEEETDETFQHSANTVTCREYYCYKLQIRDDGSLLLKAKRLLLQYIVDMYIKLEMSRLDFLRQQQHRIRADLYQGVVDSVLHGEKRASNIGKRIILPASFIGGPRNMRRNFLNAMALVQYFGKPDLFITMTCNPDWPEIQRELSAGETAQERPDIVCRIFRAKLQDLKDQLFKQHIFGRVAAHVHVVEFQKRGLPHAHILLIMQPGSKITSVEQFDKYVCAEIPDPNLQPDLHNLVIQHMLHGPCGDLNRNCSCMKKGQCKYHYPRPFLEETTQGKDSYPMYRRRSSGPEVLVRSTLYNNKWVVPYNPYLLSRYNCHLNVEICSGIKAVKYLYKYIYKGHDRVAFHIISSEENTPVDEIQRFQEARYVTSQEGIWRIFEFELNEIYPAVFPLQLHLPNHHLISFHENENLQKVASDDRSSRSMLTEYFRTCSTDVAARNYLYTDFPQHYVWDRKGRQWRPRQKGVSIGRLCSANPSEGERYYLRLLLNNIKGPRSYEDLLTVCGTRYSTFKEAAEKRGLLASDDYVSKCLHEASTFQMPDAFRRLFATVLIFLSPPNVRLLWDEHFSSLSEDFNTSEVSEQSKICFTLERIAYFLESMGSSIQQFDLPQMSFPNVGNNNEIPRAISDELSIKTPHEDACLVEKLNSEQQVAYTTILTRVYSNHSGAFFIDGPGGTGKTFLYQALLWSIRSRGDIAIATASSGAAASILPGGRTAHSRFSLPLYTDDSTVCNISKQSSTAELLRRAKLIIWDEAPMAKRYNIEALDRSLQDIMSTQTIFGGKVIVFGGDFRQVLPVVRKGTRGQVVNASLAMSYLWNQLEKLKLKENMRAKTDAAFCSYLLRIGNGEEPENESGMVEIPEKLLLHCETDVDPELTLINHIYPSLEENLHSSSYITQRAILATKNEHVDMINEKLINMFPMESRTYRSFDEAVDDTNNFYPEDFLNTLTPSGFPQHVLVLKPNCPIVLLRNIDPANGLCNGTRLVCKRFEANVIHAEISMGHHIGKPVFLHRIQFVPNEGDELPFQFRRMQFPVRLAFSMTINKAQGQTIPIVGVYLPEPVFSHGQLYVALSRGTSMETTKVLLKGPPSSDIPLPSYTKNIVYKEVLTD